MSANGFFRFYCGQTFRTSRRFPTEPRQHRGLQWRYTQAGTPLTVVAQQLGHANTDTVSRTYGHLAPQIREAQVRTHFARLTGTLSSAL